jgi:magnesium transporter
MSGCDMATAIEFDFGTKQERVIPPEAVPSAFIKGNCCWIDLDLGDRAAAESVLRELGVHQVVVDEALNAQVAGRHDVYEECVHVVVTAASFKDGQLTTSQVDIIVGEQFIVTLHRGSVDFLEQVRRTYSKDFQKFAKTLSFLLYEIWDHLLDSYLKVLRRIEDEVELIQSQMLAEVDDQIFIRVGKLTRELLQFRKLTLTAREVLHELATRRSSFVAETSQPFLNNMVDALERLSSDLSVERETLAETLYLYMGIVSHRTNKVMNRLTTISVIFLPLTFLCGVYGMNFEYMPELSWPLGYAFFWLFAASVGGGLLWLMKKNRWM